MKKRIVAVLTAVVLMLSALSPAAFAEALPELTLPGLASCNAEEAVLVSAESGVYIYECADVESAFMCAVQHAAVLTEYGFDSVTMDQESNESFVYLCVTEYTGSADIEPELLVDCKTPCYVIYGLTNYAGHYVVCVTASEGIVFDDEAAVSEDPELILGEEGRYIMAPEEYLELLPAQDISIDNGWYMYIYGGQKDGYREKFLQFRDDLIASGYYELVDQQGGVVELYALDYIGPDEVENFWNFNAYGSIMIEFFGESVWLCVSNDIILSNLQEIAERYAGYTPGGADNSGGSTEKTAEKCIKCGGSGKMECKACNGGWVDDPGSSLGKKMCTKCNFQKVPCDWCGGSGKRN
ncbi:MAG: hypothetical protein IJE08_06515 [Clostridia bacterium]|nr:hypothetical protein [Clostridia bacterium]